MLGLGQTGEEKSEEHAHNFLRYQGYCSQRIRPGRPNSQLRMLLWCFEAIVKMCEDFAPKFGDKKLAVGSRQRTVSHFLFHH
jgi:hypothetical protein